MESKLSTVYQGRTYRKSIDYHGKPAAIVVNVHYDDTCRNGHNTFSITGHISDGRGEIIGGCIHEEIAEFMPELSHLIKWHLVSSDGPMHYIANTVYHASDRDHNGLRAGESKQLISGRSKLPIWELSGMPDDRTIAAAECPAPITLTWQPCCRIGEGKARNLDFARSSAVWPEASDAELMADDLAAKLAARLPALMVEFRSVVESLGFTY